MNVYNSSMKEVDTSHERMGDSISSYKTVTSIQKTDDLNSFFQIIWLKIL